MTMDDVDRKSHGRYNKVVTMIAGSFLIMIGLWFFSTRILGYESDLNKSAAAASCADVRYLARELANDFTERANFEMYGHPAPITVRQAMGWRATASALLSHRFTTCPVPVVSVPRERITISPKGSSP